MAYHSFASFDAIIFDHDGTLVDTETPDFLACQTLCAELGVDLSQSYWAETIAGQINGYDQLFDELIRPVNNGMTRERMWHRLKSLWKETLTQVTLMPGLPHLLQELQAAGYPMAVATASDRTWVTRWLSQFKLMPYFQTVSCGDDVIHNKPAPDVYLHAAAQLKVSPERCLVFEDTIAGLRAALGAGMTAVAVPSHITKHLDVWQAHHTIGSLEEVSVEWIAEVAVSKLSI